MGQALAEERRAIYAETYYPRLHHGWSELRSAIDRDFHYIEGPAPELYRLSDDPAEHRNLLADEPRVAAALRSAIARVAEEPAAPALEDTETRRRLEALGYLSAPARKTAGTVAEPLLDPKAQLPALRALEEARRRFSSGDLDSARRSLEGLVEAQPAMVDAWETLGDVLESGGQLEAAVEARRRAVETSGGAPEQTLKIAPLLLRLGRVEEAKSHARVALDAFPAVARTILARIAMASGDLEEAEREARAAVASRSGTTTPVLTLAEVLAERGDAAGALGVIAGVEDELRTRSLPDPRPFLLRSELLRAGGDAGGAVEALDEASRLTDRLLAINPSSPAAHAARARIFELRGDEERSIEALERALEAGALDDVSKPRLALEWSRRGRAGDAAALVEALAGRGDLDAMHALAVARSEEGDQAAARRVLRLALERDPDQTAVLETLGLVELRAGDARAALQPLERATELGVESANAWNLLGVARWQDARDAAGALAAWERALTLDPTRWETLYNLARVASETGRADLARGALERFVAGAPAERYGAELTEARAALAKLGGGAGAP
jgi:tetratricopeptide (TPR) repeat protein